MVKYNEKRLYKRLACFCCAVLLAFSFIALPICFYNASADEITTSSEYHSRVYSISQIDNNFLDSDFLSIDTTFNFIDTSNGLGFYFTFGSLDNTYDSSFNRLPLSYHLVQSDIFYSTNMNPVRIINSFFGGVSSVNRITDTSNSDFSYLSFVSIQNLRWLVNIVNGYSVSDLHHYSITYAPPYVMPSLSDKTVNVNGIPFTTSYYIINGAQNLGSYTVNYYSSSNSLIAQISCYTNYFGSSITYNGVIGSSSVNVDPTLYDNAYNQGYRQAEQELTTKYEQLLTIEYDNGFYAGKEQSTNFAQYFLAIAEVPFNVIRNMLNFEILGVNISGLVFAILTGALCITVIRWFI